MRVLAVTQRVVAAGQRQHEMLGNRVTGLEPVDDRRVERHGAREGCDREVPARLGADGVGVGVHLRQERLVLAGVGDDGDPGVVLGSGADHGRAADVDGLDVGLGVERVQVRHDEVERHDAVRRHVLFVARLRPIGEEAPVDLRVERHHAVVEDRRHARDVFDRRDGDPGVGDRRRAVPPDETRSTPPGPEGSARSTIPDLS